MRTSFAEREEKRRKIIDFKRVGVFTYHCPSPSSLTYHCPSHLSLTHHCPSPLISHPSLPLPPHLSPITAPPPYSLTYHCPSPSPLTCRCPSSPPSPLTCRCPSLLISHLSLPLPLISHLSLPLPSHLSYMFAQIFSESFGGVCRPMRLFTVKRISMVTSWRYS